MAKAESRRVRFNARPPALLKAGGVEIEAGHEGVLPAAEAEELAANPFTGVELLDEPAPELENKEHENGNV